jgi:hypothetical protein
VRRADCKLTHVQAQVGTCEASALACEAGPPMMTPKITHDCWVVGCISRHSFAILTRIDIQCPAIAIRVEAVCEFCTHTHTHDMHVSLTLFPVLLFERADRQLQTVRRSSKLVMLCSACMFGRDVVHSTWFQHVLDAK